MWIPSLGQQDPLEKEMATHSSILARKIPGQRSLVVAKSWTQLKRLSTLAHEVSEYLNFFNLC